MAFLCASMATFTKSGLPSITSAGRKRDIDLADLSVIDGVDFTRSGKFGKGDTHFCAREGVNVTSFQSFGHLRSSQYSPFRHRVRIKSFGFEEQTQSYFGRNLVHLIFCL